MEEYRRQLGDPNLTDEQIRKIIDTLDMFARAMIEQFLQDQKNRHPPA